jgi:hypothetical protein
MVRRKPPPNVVRFWPAEALRIPSSGPEKRGRPQPRNFSVYPTDFRLLRQLARAAGHHNLSAAFRMNQRRLCNDIVALRPMWIGPIDLSIDSTGTQLLSLAMTRVDFQGVCKAARTLKFGRSAAVRAIIRCAALEHEQEDNQILASSWGAAVQGLRRHMAVN